MFCDIIFLFVFFSVCLSFSAVFLRVCRFFIFKEGSFMEFACCVYIWLSLSLYSTTKTFYFIPKHFFFVRINFCFLSSGGVSLKWNEKIPDNLSFYEQKLKKKWWKNSFIFGEKKKRWKTTRKKVCHLVKGGKFMENVCVCKNEKWHRIWKFVDMQMFVEG